MAFLALLALRDIALIFLSKVRELWNVPFRELEGFVRKLSEFSSGH
ncbi:MAG: hypothetical protein QXQ46_05565 [Thermoplasmatales archaeon]